MSSVFQNTSEIFFCGGVIFGVVMTIVGNKLFGRNNDRKKSNDIGNDIQCDYIPDSFTGDNKLVLVVRNDLKMGKGKVAAQCSHAAVLAHESARKKCPDIFRDWKLNGQPKIVVKIDSEDEMLKLAEQAKKYKLLASIVSDAGRTQIAAGSKTVLAVGPGPENVINTVTGHLKLY